MEKEWYVVNTYSGHEAKVKEKLESRAVSMGMQDNIFRVIIPETTEVEVKDGVKKEKRVRILRTRFSYTLRSWAFSLGFQ